MLAQKLKQARCDADITQRALAARLGKAHSFPNKVETADRELNVIELMDYCAALGVDFEAFVRELRIEVEESRQKPPSQPQRKTSKEKTQKKQL